MPLKGSHVLTVVTRKLLKSRYNHPQLIHQAHIQIILEAPSLTVVKNCIIYTTSSCSIWEHLRLWTIITIHHLNDWIEGTVFERQKHSQASTAMSELLDIHAQVSESSAPDKVKGEVKGVVHSAVWSFAATTTSYCVICKTMKHPLYVCPRFTSMPHDKMSTVKVHELYMNCLSFC